MLADMPPPFDTQRIAADLHADDFTRRQADGIVCALAAATRHLATRADLIALKAELAATMDRQKAELAATMDRQKAELAAAMDRQTIDLIKWIVGLAVGFAALGLGMVGATIAVLRWFGAGVQ